MSDKAAAPEETKKTKAEPKQKKTATKKKTQLDDMIAEAKAAFGEISTTGDRQLRKRPESSRASGPAAKKPAKKTAPKTKKPAADKKTKEKAVNGKAAAEEAS